MDCESFYYLKRASEDYLKKGHKIWVFQNKRKMRQRYEQMEKILGEKVKTIIYLFILHGDIELEALVEK